MIKYDYKGIKIDATLEIKKHDYKNSNNTIRTYFEREVVVIASLLGFVMRGNFQEFAFVKSVLQYFLQGYWKRPNKEGTKFELVKVLKEGEWFHNNCTLNFDTKQKDNKLYLYVCVKHEETVLKEVYLDVQEVMMLDIALGKAINLLMPDIDSF